MLRSTPDNFHPVCLLDRQENRWPQVSRRQEPFFIAPPSVSVYEQRLDHDDR